MVSKCITEYWDDSIEKIECHIDCCPIGILLISIAASIGLQSESAWEVHQSSLAIEKCPNRTWKSFATKKVVKEILRSVSITSTSIEHNTRFTSRFLWQPQRLRFHLQRMTGRCVQSECSTWELQNLDCSTKAAFFQAAIRQSRPIEVLSDGPGLARICTANRKQPAWC